MRKNIHITNEVELKQYITQFQTTVIFSDIESLTRKQYAKSSCLAMCKDWNHFIEFCQHFNLGALPAEVDTIRLFIHYLSSRRKYSSIRRNVITIGQIHQILNLKDPTNTNITKRALFELKANKGSDEKATTELSIEQLDTLTDILLRSDNTKDIRDLALIRVMFECALKRKDIRDLTFNQIDLAPERYTLQLDDNSLYQLTELTTLVLRRWVSFIDGCGVVFRAIDKHGNIGSSPLNDSSIYRIFRAASEKLGVPGLTFSGQSTRVGAVKELHRQGYSIRDIQKFGRWQSYVMPAHYLENDELAEQGIIEFKQIKPLD